MAVRVLLATDPSDDSLAGLRPVAEALENQLSASTSMLGPDTTGADLVEATHDAEGVVLLGHGNGHAFLGTRSGPAWLTADNAQWTRDRWVHLIACLCGVELVPRIAEDAGAACAAGYRTRLIVDAQVAELPPGLRQRVDQVWLVTTRSLAEGTYDKREIQRRLDAAQLAILRELPDEHAFWVQALLGGLVRNLVVATP